ncbi:MAG: hypothetical protein JO222_12050 [Frankiales bacterium]|nr:hypothetical protein [Frankiales bacterium]
MEPAERDAIDDLVQGIAVAKYALEAGDMAVAAEAVDTSLAKARALLSAAGTTIDLRRRTPAL